MVHLCTFFSLSVEGENVNAETGCILCNITIAIVENKSMIIA